MGLFAVVAGVLRGTRLESSDDGAGGDGEVGFENGEGVGGGEGGGVDGWGTLAVLKGIAADVVGMAGAVDARIEAGSVADVARAGPGTVCCWG